jgi:DNA-binding Lrp family transcriptional regulator
VRAHDGVLSRFGPLYNADRLGAAVTLAAMRVPEAGFDEVAETVNARPEVAHNYARDHAFNMWFIIAADSRDRIDEVIAGIEAETGLEVYDMPKTQEFFVELRLEA